jgi:hypothetical protein
VRRWLADRRWEGGVTLTAVEANDLAQAWWSTRLDPAWRPRTVDESQAILDGLGLRGEFWQLT